METATLQTGKPEAGAEATEPGVTVGRLAREVTGLPVIINGGIHDPEQATQILNGGHGDLVSLGRGALANSDWPQRLAAEQPLEAFDPDVLEPTAALTGDERQ